MHFSVLLWIDTVNNPPYSQGATAEQLAQMAGDVGKVVSNVFKKAEEAEAKTKVEEEKKVQLEKDLAELQVQITAANKMKAEAEEIYAKVGLGSIYMFGVANGIGIYMCLGLQMAQSKLDAINICFESIQHSQSPCNADNGQGEAGPGRAELRCEPAQGEMWVGFGFGFESDGNGSHRILNLELPLQSQETASVAEGGEADAEMQE